MNKKNCSAAGFESLRLPRMMVRILAVMVVGAGWAMTANASGVMDIKEGALIKSSDKPEVYLVVWNQKRHIANEAVFNACGLDWGKIQTLGQLQVDEIPTAAPLTAGGDCKAAVSSAAQGPQGACERAEFFRLQSARLHGEYRKTDSNQYHNLKQPIKSAIVSANDQAKKADEACQASRFTGKGPQGCTDRRCWQEAVNNAVNACTGSGCSSCSRPANAGDNCKFEDGYTCHSICSQ